MADETKKDVSGETLPASALGSAKDQIREHSTDFQSVYANNVALTISAWDVALNFGQIIGEQDDKPVVGEIVKVHMSREFAKVLIILLGENLKRWESQFGEIKIPDMQAVSELGTTAPAAQVKPTNKAKP